MEISAQQKLHQATALSQRAVERVTGALLLAYMAAVVVSVASRVASNADQEPFRASLQLIAEDQGLYLTSLAANLVSNFLLIFLAGALYLTFRVHQRHLALPGSYLFLAAGLIWMVSNISGLTLARLAQEFISSAGSTADMVAASAWAVELIREFAGRVAFTLAALGLLTFGGLICWSRAVPVWLGWLAVMVGALMLFIWYDAATALHRIGGTGYLLWLLVAGGWLLLRGTQEVAPEINLGGA